MVLIPQRHFAKFATDSCIQSRNGRMHNNSVFLADVVCRPLYQNELITGDCT